MGPVQPVSINGTQFDALIDSSEKHDADVPEYPIDEGYNVSDNVALAAMEVDMTLYLTATPVTWMGHGVGMGHVLSASEGLVQAMKKRQPLTVVTQDKTYNNMVISSLENKKSQEIGYAREISVTLKQIDVATAKAVGIPGSAKAGKGGATGKSTGSASTRTSSSGSNTSSAASAASSGVDYSVDYIDRTAAGGAYEPYNPNQNGSKK